jgi:ribosomal protein L12E/L44/L45/RPP1/RPP2
LIETEGRRREEEEEEEEEEEGQDLAIFGLCTA